jgi:hypothetical protein
MMGGEGVFIGKSKIPLTHNQIHFPTNYDQKNNSII